MVLIATISPNLLLWARVVRWNSEQVLETEHSQNKQYSRNTFKHRAASVSRLHRLREPPHSFPREGHLAEPLRGRTAVHAKV